MDQDSSKVVQLKFSAPAAEKSKNELCPTEKLLSEKKRGLFEAWLQKGTVCVMFDARKLGVKVPDQFAYQADLRLNFCYQFQIHDFGFNASAVWGTLSFPAGEFFCQVPWTAVYSMHSVGLAKDNVWFASFPSDLEPEKVFGLSEEKYELAEVDKKCNVISLDAARKKQYSR